MIISTQRYESAINLATKCSAILSKFNLNFCQRMLIGRFNFITFKYLNHFTIMKGKKILIGILAVGLLLAAAFFYFDYRNKSLSPPGSETLTSGGLTVSVTYSRPSVRGRLIFGAEEQQALQPYGKYWRLGANDATQITFSRDVLFNGSAVKAGTYRIFAFPGAETFELGLNTELDKWGYSEPDYDLDILRTKVPVEKTNAPVEQYTISLAPEGDGINMIFEWSDTRFVAPIKVQ
jgi:hypothetical protein